MCLCATRENRLDMSDDKILEEREAGTALKKQAVLFRASHHSGLLEIELTRRNIPFVKFGGLKFLDSVPLRMCSPYYASQKTRATALRRSVSYNYSRGLARRPLQTRWMRWRRALDPLLGLTVFPGAFACGERLARFCRPVFDNCAPARHGPPEYRARQALVSAAFGAHPRGTRWYSYADLLQLEEIAAGYSSRERFLTDLTLDPPDATSDEAGPPHLDEDYLILSTIHSAKGQEWTKVFVLNAVDGCIPSDLAAGERDEIEEERRLLYVAMTRAKDSLYLVTPQRFFVHAQAARGDRHVYASRTRFITEGMLGHFERVSWPPPAVGGRAPQPDIRVDLKSKMRSIWRTE